MQYATWVIDFGRRARMAAPPANGSNPFETMRIVAAQRRRSRQMFATTRALLAEARAVLATGPRRTDGRRARASV
jgi:hypothetical protein